MQLKKVNSALHKFSDFQRAYNKLNEAEKEEIDCIVRWHVVGSELNKPKETEATK